MIADDFEISAKCKAVVGHGRDADLLAKQQRAVLLVRVVDCRVDIDRRELDFRLIQHGVRPSQRTERPARGKAKHAKRPIIKRGKGRR